MENILQTITTDIETALMPVWVIIKTALQAIESQLVGDLVRLIEAEVAAIAEGGIVAITTANPSAVIGNILTTALNQGRKDILNIDASVINALVALKLQAAKNTAGA